MNERLDLQYRLHFQRLLLVLLKHRRFVQIGEPLKHTANTARRQFTACCWVIRLLWIATGLMSAAGCYLIWSGDKPMGIILCECALFPVIFAFILQRDNYVPSRWIVFKDGLLIRTAKDRRIFVPWVSVLDFETKFGNMRSKLVVHTESNTVEWIQAERENLLPFLSKLLVLLPDGFDRSPLQNLQRKLQFAIIHYRLFRDKEVFSVWGLMLCVPVMAILNFLFSPIDIGFLRWFMMMGGVVITAFGSYFIIRNRMKRRHENYINILLDELEHTDRESILTAHRLTEPPFGLPPRTISDKAKRTLFYSSDTGFIQKSLIGAFGFLVLFAAMMVNNDEIRCGFLPLRWEPAGEGKIVAIDDSSTKKTPGGIPATSGCDIITLEQTLADGRTILCRNPIHQLRGRFHIGQTVPLLRYSGDSNFLMIDDPNERCQIWAGLGALSFFVSIFVVIMVLTTFYGLSAHNRVIRLLETAPVKRFRVGRNGKKIILLPVDLTLPTIPLKDNCTGFVLDETVNVFFNEEKPEQSFIAYSSLIFDSETGRIDIVSDLPFRLGVASLVLFIAGLGMALLRILLVY